LSQALRKHEEFGVISLDMDGLKEINDNYGIERVMQQSKKLL
jgi:GGDEF domain-containing protein